MNARRWSLGLLLAATLIGLPPAAARPPVLSIVATEGARTVDFEGGVVWFLLLGSDARPGTDVLKGNADAIQLVGVDFDTGTATAVGLPRDTWLEVEGRGLNRLNAALHLGGPGLVADTVAELVGIEPDYVLTAGLTGFAAMVESIGGVRVLSPRGFTDSEHEITVRRGPNQLDGERAARFARARRGLPRNDFDRVANHQELLKGILRQLRAHEGEPGFMEAGAWEAIARLDTNLDPVQLYRLAHAVTDVRLQAVTTCVITGTPLTTSGGAQVIEVDRARAQAVGRDVREDARLDGAC